MPRATTTTVKSRTLTLRSRTIDKRMSSSTNRPVVFESGHYAFALGQVGHSKQPYFAFDVISSQSPQSA